MIITDEFIENGRSSLGAWGAKQVRTLGVEWPLKKGWKERLIGKTVTDAAAQRFLDLKDAHFRKVQREAVIKNADFIKRVFETDEFE